MSGELALAFALILVSAVLLVVIIRQQVTIERLNDRLMSRTYGEYKTSGIKEEDASPSREDEPLSWHDH